MTTNAAAAPPTDDYVVVAFKATRAERAAMHAAAVADRRTLSSWIRHRLAALIAPAAPL